MLKSDLEGIVRSREFPCGFPNGTIGRREGVPYFAQLQQLMQHLPSLLMHNRGRNIEEWKRMGRSPNNWNGYIGQRHIVLGLARLIQGSKLRSEPLPNILIPGNSGLGKTQLVQTIATDFGTKLHFINGRKDIDLIQLGLLAREWAENLKSHSKRPMNWAFNSLCGTCH